MPDEQARPQLSVDAESWHYRLYAWGHDRWMLNVPRQLDLCRYFWGVVGSVGIAIAAGFVKLLRAAWWISRPVLRPTGRGLWWTLKKMRLGPACRSIGRWVDRHDDLMSRVLAWAVGVLVAVYLGYVLYKGILWSVPWTIGIIGMVVAGIALLILLGMGLSELSDRRRRQRRNKVRLDEEEAPSASSFRVAWQFVVAKKRRVCPLIEVK